MAILSLATNMPLFRTGELLSAAKLNTMRDAALAQDEASRLGGVAFCASYGNPPQNDDENPNLIWRGGFTMVDGATTLTIVLVTSSISGVNLLRVTRTGASAISSTHDLDNPPGPPQTITIDITPANYSNGQIVLVDIELYNAAGGASENWGDIEIREVSLTPISISDTWPGVPTFGAISAANLNQLANAIDWLTLRMGTRYDPLFQGVVRRFGPFFQQGDVQLRATVRRSPSHGTVIASGYVLREHPGATERVTLTIGLNVVATYNVPAAVGQHEWTLSTALPGSTGDIIYVMVQYERTAPDEDNGGLLGINRWSVNEIYTSSDTTAPVTLEQQVARQRPSFSSLQSWLNSLATIVNATYTRIVTTNAALWSRQICYRARYGRLDQQAWFEPGGLAMRWRRAGDAVAIRGRGVSIGVGGAQFERTNEVGFYEFSNTRSTSIIPGDATQSVLWFLDNAPGLPSGAPYNLRGVDLLYAAERLKTVV
jgi:hypothetical protein